MAEGSFYGETLDSAQRFAIEHERRTDTKKAEMLTSEGESRSVLKC
jgi:hypothetical protein